MEAYVRFTIYANLPSLLIITIPAVHNLTTDGNWLALMAFYNLVLYVIPVTIILAYLIHSLVKGLKPHKVNIALYFALSTICIVLFIVAWFVLAPIVALVSYAISYVAVRLYRSWRASGADVNNE